MTGQKLPLEDHIIRIIPPARLRRDADNNVIGILSEAFRLRDKEEYLSATWLEFFDGDLHAAVHVIRACKFEVRKSSGFAIGNVDVIIKACASRNHAIRIVHEPTDENEGHAAVRRFPRDDILLEEALAESAWSELVLNVNIP
jgi:hypothetical protein